MKKAKNICQMDDAYTNKHLTTFILSFWKYLATYKINNNYV